METRPQTAIAAVPTGASPREIAAALLALLLVTAGQIAATRSWVLFSRHFWLDEIYTHTLVADPHLSHSLQALAAGVETHPPTLYLALRAYTALVQSTEELALRSFAYLVMLAALTGIYACLRYAFPASACAVAVFSTWCHPLVVEQAFNARFYALWLAGVVWFAFFLSRTRVPGRLGSAIALALCAALVCTTHYFGVVTLLLVTAGEAWARHRAGLSLTRGVLAAAAGFAALMCCLPLLLGQRGATSVDTWMEPIDSSRALRLLHELEQGYPLVWLAVAAWFSCLNGGPPADARSRHDALAGLTALIVMPALMIAFSYVVQPVYQARYCLPAIAGLAPAAAWIASQTSRLWQALTLAGLIVSGSAAVASDAASWRDWASSIDRLIAELRVGTDKERIVFESPAQLYVVDRYAPDMAQRTCLLDFESGQIGNVSGDRLFMRDLARRYHNFYPQIPLCGWSEVRTMPHFFLVSARFAPSRSGLVVDAFYPGFRVQRLAPELYELTRTGVP